MNYEIIRLVGNPKIKKAAVADLDSIEEGYIEHFAHEKKYGAYTVFREEEGKIFPQLLCIKSWDLGWRLPHR